MLPAILSSPSSSSTSTFPLRYSSLSSLTNLSSLPLTIGCRRTSKKSTHNNCSIRVQASSRMIEKETPETERPHTFLRESDEGSSGDDSSKPNSVRARFEKMIREVQDSVCAALEDVDGGGKFKEDVWSRPGGGGGISRVLQDGDVFEKAGVNVSVVYGVMPPEAYRAARPVDNGDTKPGPIPFFAAGVSSVIHPKNPFAPTVHFNYRYFETDAPKDTPGAPRQWWFGGGTDLTPAYIFEDDVKHFHSKSIERFFYKLLYSLKSDRKVPGLSWLATNLKSGSASFIGVQKGACDKFDASFYPRFKKWCDDYFYIKHRDERRGLGGIFFDDLNDYDQEMLLSFSTECANSVIPAYIPIIEKRKDTPFTDEHKAWQQLRRGRYVEFNLVYDRGTTFGLKTGGRIESILVSLPLSARWEYDHQPLEGSEEWKLLDACINPKEWIC